MVSEWKMFVFAVFLICIFQHSDWIRWDTPYLSVFSPDAGKYGPKKLRIWTLYAMNNNSNNNNIIIIHASYEQCSKCFMWTLDNWLWLVRRREVLGNTAVLGTRSGHNAKNWVGETEGITDVPWHHLHVVHIEPLYSFEHVPSQTTYAVRLLHCLD